MKRPVRIYQERLAQELITHLQERSFAAFFVATAEEARQQVLGLLPEEGSVYRCGSMTIEELGIWEEIARLPGLSIINPFQEGLTADENLERRRRGLTADLLICSCNAITLDGRLVNVDGTGNRVAAMIFGTGKVIIVAGMNKVVPDLESAFSRIRHYAAPINCIRVRARTPCTRTGLCSDCRGPERRCNKWSIIEGSKFPGRIHIILVGEHLGY